MRTLGTLIVAYGLVLASIGANPAAGFSIAFVGWVIRRYNK